MKLIEPHVTLVEEKDPYKKVELAGRTCYKSEAKITEDSAVRFTKGLIKSTHTAMLEHAVFVFEWSIESNTKFSHYLELGEFAAAIDNTPYFHRTEVTTKDGSLRVLISANARAISQRGINDPIYRAVKAAYPDIVWGVNNTSVPKNPGIEVKLVDLADYDDLTEDEILAHKYLTFRFLTDRGVTHELVRHRPCSFAQESTRYVNYQNGLSIALPAGFYEKTAEAQEVYADAFVAAQDYYKRLIEMGEKPQQARAVLPTALKTEIVVTANMTEWNHIFDLRYFGTTGAPHPDIQLVTGMAYNLAKTDEIAAKVLRKEEAGD